MYEKLSGGEKLQKFKKEASKEELFPKTKISFYGQKQLKEKLFQKTLQKKIENTRNSKEILIRGFNNYIKTDPNEEIEEKESNVFNTLKRNKSINSSLTKLSNKVNVNYNSSLYNKRSINENINMRTKSLLNDSFNLEIDSLKGIQFLELRGKLSQIPFEYLSDIFENLHDEETRIRIKSNWSDIQPDVNEKMRAVVVNWLIEVHLRFKLYPETLFLCVNLMDRFLSLKKIDRTRLQLLGVTCLLIACKYEEIFSPEIRDFVCILDKSYEKEHIILMEHEILRVLKFDVTIPSILKFFELISIKLKLSKKEYYLGNYLLELSLLNLSIYKYPPSLIASTVSYMTLCWSPGREKEKEKNSFFNFINYREDQIIECSMEICFILENIEKSKYQAPRKKFMNKNLGEVSNIKI